jgi:hypothetical protein
MSDTPENLDGPKIGEVIEGQMLVGVGINFTFTEIHPDHREAFTTLDQWMSGLRLYSLEDLFELDANVWDELLDCGYEVGEGEIDGEQPGQTLAVYDVWTDAATPLVPLENLKKRLLELKAMALDHLPSGLHPAAATHENPQETLKLIAQLSP